jgi:hypothetical protein
MFGWLASLLGSPILKALGGQLNQALATYEAAQTSQAKVDASVEIQQIQAMIAAQHDATALRRATSAFWEQRVLVFLAGIGPTMHYLAVCFVSTWPSAVPGWVVVKLPAPMDSWEGYIILSFFGLIGVRGITQLAAWRKK